MIRLLVNTLNIIAVTSIYAIVIITLLYKTIKGDYRMGTIKTKRVVLREGELNSIFIVARGVKVNTRNLIDIAHWAPGSSVAFTLKKDVETLHRVKVKTKAGIRAAYVGDIVVKKGSDDFIVIKAEDFATRIVI